MKFRPGHLVALVSCLALPLHAAPRTASTAERTACEAKIQPRIDDINARLRSGYSAEEGEKLRAQRRSLEAQRAACRKAS
jgi:hypothetical protein